MRVDRCFAFVDLCGFTAFCEEHGDDQIVGVLAELRTAVRDAAARRGVRLVKWLGDGAMLSSTTVDALAGLLVELQLGAGRALPSLPLRAGIARGEAIMFEGDDYIGYPVNLAARLCAQAGPHELLATAPVVAGVPPWVTAVRRRTVSVRGLPHPVEACDLTLAAPGDDAVTDPVCGLAIRRCDSIGAADGARFCSEACRASWVPHAVVDRIPAHP